ncbi:MAG: DUF4224 domain-containing protein [Burkholderiales bacterium]|nr:DUF4224 domain-containing protein [Burkholderiales bacterium]
MPTPTQPNSVIPSSPPGDNSSGSFLSDEDVARLTGYRQTKKIIGALNSMGIPFVLSFQGRALVPKAAIASTSTGRRRDGRDDAPARFLNTRSQRTVNRHE